MQVTRSLLIAVVLLAFASNIVAVDAATLEHGGNIQSVEFHPSDSSKVVSASDDNDIKLWDLDTDTATTFSGHTDKVNSVAFSPDGTKLASGSDDRTVKLWNVSDQTVSATLEHIPVEDQSASIVTAVAFDPDGATLATAGYQTVKLWDLSEYAVSHTFQHEGWVYAVVYSPNGDYLAVIHGDGKKIKIWNVNTKASITDLTGDIDWIGDIAFSSDSSTFADAGRDGIVTFRSTSDWSVDGTISVYASVNDLAFSADGDTLAAGAYGVKLLSVDNGETIATLTSPDDWINEVAFSSDGDTVASSAFSDGTLHTQDVATVIDSQPAQDAVRVIYFVPSDRTAQSDIDSKIETLIESVQTFFADEMDEHGYGQKTFTYETDDDDEMVIHHLTGKFTDSYYNSNDKWKVWDEIKAAGFDPTRNLCVAVMDFSEILDGLHCGTGGHWSHGGVVNLVIADGCLDGDAGVALAVHEFGHAFGLPHDYRNHSDRTIDLGNEDDPLVTTACATEWLDAHRCFNSGRDYYNEPTTISLSSTTISGSQVALNFSISDADGLHQAQLLSPYMYESYFAGRAYFADKSLLDMELDDCQSISGNSATAAFVTSQLTSGDDTVSVRVIDDKGNITQSAFSVSLSSLSPMNNSPSDVNSDGLINFQDMGIVASNFGKVGLNSADVNRDGIVNIQDLVLVAGAFDEDAAAPSARHRMLKVGITSAEVQQWLREARQMNLTDSTFQRGLLVLEQLLAALTPQETALLPNYPNPFNPETWIPYQLAVPADVAVSIYAADGNLVRTLELGHQPVGIYESRSRAAYWDGRNALGEFVASGVYFFTLTAGDFAATRKMLIRK